jgi:hypothetical protein
MIMAEIDKSEQVNKHLHKIIEVIKKHKTFTFTDIFCDYTAISRSTAYSLGLNELDDIKEALMQNRRTEHKKAVAKLLASDNPTLFIAGLKLISEPDELKRLSTSHVDMTTNGKDINAKKMTDEEIQEEIERLTKVQNPKHE